MARLWKCECGWKNRDSNQQCDDCKRARPEDAAVVATTRDADGWKCVWFSRGQRCRMPGTIGNQQGGFRCSWHYNLLTNPRLAEEFEEFERWVLMLVEVPYCSVWTHDPVEALWAAVHGERPLPPFPQPCRLLSCPHAVPPEEILSAREAFRDVRALLAGIGGGTKKEALKVELF